MMAFYSALDYNNLLIEKRNLHADLNKIDTISPSLASIIKETDTLSVEVALSFSFCLSSQRRPGPVAKKIISCSTQLSMKFFLLINVKMPTIVGILTFMSRKYSILDLPEPEKISFLIYLYLSIRNFMLSRVQHENFV